MFNQPTDAPKGNWFSSLWRRVDSLGPVLLERRVVTAATANVDFKLIGNYDSFLVKIYSLIPTTDNTSIILRYSTDNGATFLSGASDYRLGYSRYNEDGVADEVSVAATSGITFMTGLGSSTGENFNAELELANPLASGHYKVVRFTTYAVSSAPTAHGSVGVGACDTQTGIINAIRFLPLAGNWSSGIFKLYGVR